MQSLVIEPGAVKRQSSPESYGLVLNESRSLGHI